MQQRISLAFILYLITSASLSSAQSSPQRSGDGLLVLYNFTEGGGQTIHDRSGSGPPVDLVIEKSNAVKWSKGALIVKSSACSFRE